jgi:hypothetical protein
MVHIELTREEMQIMVELLDSSISDLRTEVRQTDKREYRIMLQQREAVMKKILVSFQERLADFEPVI